ncbi:carotenoid biosynthesis protein [Flavobacteriaceae bacterium]|jgi:putative membrane protein|nr:carotenoid biosynthesis protein [Cryomorphaceae bacterium]MBT4237611.1 carotenoid biosynthesis protein [Cryomorphaceae bacterium]MBT5416653.1 carotenoid biosynthesis protein [Cryomorphaceae bacterium]MBT6729807.1 carotenoid biosynthesis protein [Cryomorphaceae bacterium]MDA9595995.1 carotenoid biosynthesis protein [Flavobacteriaceae bacterium]|tara:strand:- start:640 stop:1287 length:648 start_codon:yes stop_codon:yes gene_type:complete
MTGLSNNKEFLRMSIFFLWLINISGFFGMLSDQNEFFLSTTPYVLSLTLLLLILNHNLSSKKSKIGLMLIFLFGLIVELLGVNYGLFFGDYSYGANLGSKIYGVPYVIGFNWVLLIIATGSVSDKLIKGKEVYKIIFASFLMVLIDLLMEKSAPKLDFWEFVISPVPFSNYLWWFIFSLCFQYIFFKTVKTKEYNLSSNILVIQFIFFGMLAVFL